jgi:glycerophosphoryl diester phosphodiesterase
VEEFGPQRPFDLTEMNEQLAVSALAKSVWRDFLRARRALWIYEISFKLAEAWLLVPAVAVVLAALRARAYACRGYPRLRTGIIVAHALGDINRLEVDALSVRADFLSDALLRSAHGDGKEVHVWTVNDAREMFGLMKRGVDNIITSDPDLAIHVRNEWASLSGSERLVLASHLLLGLDP